MVPVRAAVTAALLILTGCALPTMVAHRRITVDRIWTLWFTNLDTGKTGSVVLRQTPDNVLHWGEHTGRVVYPSRYHQMWVFETKDLILHFYGDPMKIRPEGNTADFAWTIQAHCRFADDDDD